jgi:hypothetical protein
MKPTFTEHLDIFNTLLDQFEKSENTTQDARTQNFINLNAFFNTNLKEVDIPKDQTEKFTTAHDRFDVIMQSNEDVVEMLNTSNYGKII